MGHATGTAARTRPAPWKALGWYALAALVLKLIADSVVFAYARPVPPPAGEVALAVATVVGVSGGLVWLAARACGGGRPGLQRLAEATGTLLPSARPRVWVPIAVAAGLAGLAVAASVHAALLALGWSEPTTGGTVRAAIEDAPLWGQAIFAFVLMALPEELIFRGVLLGYLVRRQGAVSRSGTVAAVLVTSVLFGLLHSPQGTEAVAQTCASSLLYGTLAVKYGSVWTPVVAHGTYNAVLFALG